MLLLENLTKSFAGQVLFESIGFTVAPRERIGLVGRNGHGKTTLLRLIAGEDAPDAGSIVYPKNYRIGYVRQHLDFTEATVVAEGCRGLPEAERDQIWKVEKILTGLGFSAADMQRHPAEFSGGFQVRLNLVKALAAEPDLLLLDEPTNYLDIASIRWIERFLLNWPHELILVTHDRAFMDAVATHIVGIHRRKIRKISGDTHKYYSQIAQEEAIHEKTRINQQRRQKEIEQFITRFRAKARLANLVQSRVKTLQKLETKDKLQTIETLDFSFRGRPFAGKRVLAAQEVSFSYDGRTRLIEGFDLTVRPRERICIIGKNGRGKTTLLRLLAGQLAPASGEVVPSPGVTQGIFEQTNISRLNAAATVEEEIMAAHPDVDRQQARNICGAMMFSGDDALKKIGILSGGEKSRVMLGKLLVTPTNLLLLDEPTHHLDMESSDALLDALDGFDGTVVMVTHNEMFLRRLADRLIVFQDDDIEVFEAGYTEFLESGGWRDELSASGPAAQTTAEKKAASRLAKKDRRRLRSQIMAERDRTVKQMETRIAALENKIGAAEQRLNELNAQMLEASQAQDGARIETLSKSLHTCRTEIDRLYAELEKQSADYDAQRGAFDERLEEIDRM